MPREFGLPLDGRLPIQVKLRRDCAVGSPDLGELHPSLDRILAVLELAATQAGDSCVDKGKQHLVQLEPEVGIEPTTYGLRNRCSATELLWLPSVVKVSV